MTPAPNYPELKDFGDFLIERHLLTQKKTSYYQTWIAKYVAFNQTKLDISVKITDEKIGDFLTNLGKKYESWQVEQAEEALRLLVFYQSRQNQKIHNGEGGNNEQWKEKADDMVKALRLRHRARSTEKAYLYWLRRFYLFLKNKSPADLNDDDIRDFMTFLAVEEKISANTQNQAFNALLFFFRHVLDRNINVSSAVRAKPSRRLPVVLSKEEIKRIFGRMTGTALLMAKLIYGCGLRGKECHCLRIKDLDLDRGGLTIRAGKGDKDRVTVLPQNLIPALAEQLEKARTSFNGDREKDVAGVYLPNSLGKGRGRP